MRNARLSEPTRPSTPFDASVRELAGVWSVSRLGIVKKKRNK